MCQNCLVPNDAHLGHCQKFFAITNAVVINNFIYVYTYVYTYDFVCVYIQIHVYNYNFV